MSAENVDTLYANWQTLAAQTEQTRLNLLDLENATNDAYKAFYLADIASYKEQTADERIAKENEGK